MSRRASTSVASAASLNYDPHNLEQMAGVDMDDYGFSSSDEADLAAFIANTETSTAKRKAPGPPEPALKKLKQSTPQYPTTSPLARRILNETWGYNGFRLRQEEVISRLIHGGSAAVVFPTGGGKSLVYQVPALAFGEYEEEMGIANGPGLTVVVSPLIALMKVRLVFSFLFVRRVDSFGVSIKLFVDASIGSSGRFESEGCQGSCYRLNSES